jgi:photoactive yellow protein
LRTPETISFDDEDLATVLDGLEAVDLDRLAFGVVRMTHDGRVVAYNSAEADVSGLDPAEVIGQDFFVQVAPCTNNYLIAQRYLDEEQLDEELEYVFTYRMLPTPVRLRLIKRPASEYQYLLVRRT